MSFFPIQFRLFRVRILKVRKLSALVPRNVWFNQNVPVLLKWNLCWIFGDRFVNSYIVAELNRCIGISTCVVRCDSVMQIKMFGVIYNYYIPSEVYCWTVKDSASKSVSSTFEGSLQKMYLCMYSVYIKNKIYQSILMSECYLPYIGNSISPQKIQYRSGSWLWSIAALSYRKKKSNQSSHLKVNKRFSVQALLPYSQTCSDELWKSCI